MSIEGHSDVDSAPIKDKINRLIDKLDIMEKYIAEKIEERDWHGVWDAAMDIHKIESEISILKEFVG